MVYKRYVKKGGKIHGPYYYESYRVGNTVKKRYIGTKLPSRFSFSKLCRTTFFKIGLFLVVGIVLLFAVINLPFVQFGPSEPGISISYEPKYGPDDLLTGNMKVFVKSGELIPKGSRVSIGFGDKRVEFLLSELVSVESVNGSFFVEGSSVSGSGEGYGVLGVRKVYPDVSFDLLISGPGATAVGDTGVGGGVSGGAGGNDTGENRDGAGVNDTLVGVDRAGENNTLIEGGVEENATVAKSEGNGEVVVGGNESVKEKTVNEEIATGGGSESKVEEGVSEGEGKVIEEEKPTEDKVVEKESAPAVKEVNEEPKAEEKPEEEPSEEPELSPSEMVIHASVRKGNDYAYELGDGQSVEIVPGSVESGGDVIGDDAILLKIENRTVVFSTDYSEFESGFGDDFVGEYALTFDVNVSRFGVFKDNGTLFIELIYGNETLGNFEQSVSDSEELAENDTVLGANNTVSWINVSNATIPYANVTISENVSNATIPYANVTISENVSNVETFRSRIKVGEPVKWKTNVTLDSAGGMIIELPEGAKNVSVKKVENNVEKEVEISVNTKINANNSAGKVKGGSDKGRVESEEVVKSITGNVVDVLSSREVVEVVVNDNATEYTLEYETEAPRAVEENKSYGKRVVVSAPSELKYRNVLSFANIPEVFNAGEERRVKIFWVENNSYIASNVSDLDGNGKLDYVEWIVPYLSNQTFDIILISRAEHLDENRDFVKDIYENVSVRDNIRAVIPSGHYVRVAFERNLTSDKDITIYARSFDRGSVEVYKAGGTEKIADFGEISSDGKYRILLVNLIGEQKDFDLLVTGGAVEFDYIVDPTAGWNSPTAAANDDSIGVVPWSCSGCPRFADVLNFDDGFEAQVEYQGSVSSVYEHSIKLVKSGVVSGADKSTGAVLLGSSYVMYGGPNDLWGLSLEPSDVNAVDFGVVFSGKLSEAPTYSNYLKASGFGFSIPADSVIKGIEVKIKVRGGIVGQKAGIYIDHMQMKVYYAPITFDQKISLGGESIVEESEVIPGENTEFIMHLNGDFSEATPYDDNKITEVTDNDFAAGIAGQAMSFDGSEFVQAGDDSAFDFDRVLFAGGDNGLVYKSINDGATWSSTGNFGSGVQQVYSLMESVGGTIYAGTGNGIVYKSIDGGETWAQTADFGAGVIVYSLLEDSSGTIYAGTDNGIYKSTDKGVKWTRSSLINNQRAYSLMESSDGSVYVGTGPHGYLYKIESGIGGGLTATLVNAQQVYSLLEDSSGTIYAGTGPYGRVYKLTGAIGSSVSLSDVSDIYSLLEFDGIIYAGTDNGIYKSTDEGGTWSSVSLAGINIHSLMEVSDAGGFSLTGWIEPVSSGENYRIFSKDGEFYLEVNKNSELEFGINTDSGVKSVSGGTIGGGAPYYQHVTAVYRPDVTDYAIKIYVDGNLVGSLSVNKRNREGDNLILVNTQTGLIGANSVFVSGGRAYVAEDTVLVIYDVSSPSSVGFISNVYPDPGTLSGKFGPLFVSGDFAYVADAEKVHVMDISNFAEKSLISAASANGIFVSGNYLYIVRGNAGGALDVYDIGNPLSPIASGSYVFTSEYPSSVFVSGDFAYVATNTRIMKLDVANPSAIHLSSVVNSIGSQDKLFISGDYLYDYDATGGAGKIRKYDISASGFSLVDSYGFDVSEPPISSIFVSGDYLYAGESGANPRLKIFDVSDLSNYVASINLDAQSTDLFVSDGYAYVTDDTGSGTRPGELDVFDLGQYVRSDLIIGANIFDGFFEGSIDEVALWDGWLDEAVVQKLANKHPYINYKDGTSPYFLDGTPTNLAHVANGFSIVMNHGDNDEYYLFTNFDSSLAGWWRLDNFVKYGEYDGYIRDWSSIVEPLNNDNAGTFYTGGGVCSDNLAGCTDLDLSLCGNPLTATCLQGGATLGGRYGHAYEFDGNGDYIDIADADEFGYDSQGEYTLAGWIYPYDNTNALIMAKDECLYSGSGKDNGLIIKLSNSGTLGWAQIDKQSAFKFLESTTVFNIGEWNHWAITQNTISDLKLYVNGVLEDTYSGANSPDSYLLNDLMIGGGINSGYGSGDCTTPDFNGKMDEIFIFNRALLPSEVKALMSVTGNNIPNPFSWTPEALSGVHSFQSFAVDSVGNRGETELRKINSLSPELKSTDGSDRTKQDLHCSSLFESFDGNPLSVSFKWYKNGVEQAGLSNDYTGIASGSYFEDVLGFANTNKGEVWRCEVREFNAGEDSGWFSSNDLTILNTPPVITLLTPIDGYSIMDRKPMFTWSGVDDDGDIITSDFEISLIPYFGSTCSDAGESAVLGGGVFSYTLINELQCFFDKGDYYIWKVRGNDGESYGAWVSRSIKIKSLVDINLVPPYDVVNFGQIQSGGIDDTIDNDNAPPPFVLRNDGNVLTDVTIRADDLWDAIVGKNPSQYYKFKIDEVLTEPNSYLSAQSTFLDMPAVDTSAIVGLKKEDATDSAEIDIRIEVPPNEPTKPTGLKSSTVTFTGSLGE